MLCIRMTLKTLHLISFNFRLTFLESSSTVLRSIFKTSGSVSELIVLKIIPKKVIAVSLQKCYDVFGRSNYCQNEKEKQDNSHCKDVGGTNLSTTENWNVGSRALERILQFVLRKISQVKFPCRESNPGHGGESARS